MNGYLPASARLTKIQTWNTVSKLVIIVEGLLRTWAGSLQRGGNMKIIIDKDKCRGHSNCASIAPNVFEVDAHFKSFILDPEGDGDELILKAAKACPKLAILVEDDASGACIFPGPNDKPRDQLDISS